MRPATVSASRRTAKRFRISPLRIKRRLTACRYPCPIFPQRCAGLLTSTTPRKSGARCVATEASNLPDGKVGPAEIGLTHKQVHEARVIRNAEASANEKAPPAREQAGQSGRKSQRWPFARERYGMRQTVQSSSEGRPRAFRPVAQGGFGWPGVGGTARPPTRGGSGRPGAATAAQAPGRGERALAGFPGGAVR